METKEFRQAINNRGIKQSFIAKKLGVSKALVNQWMKDKTPIADRHKVELKSLLSMVN